MECQFISKPQLAAIGGNNMNYQEYIEFVIDLYMNELDRQGLSFDEIETTIESLDFNTIEQRLLSLGYKLDESYYHIYFKN
jgi:hypothetical protein